MRRAHLVAAAGILVLAGVAPLGQGLWIYAKAGLAQALDTLALFYYMNSLFAEGADNFGLAADRLATIRDDPRHELLWGRLRTQQGWFNFLHGRQQIGRLQRNQEAVRKQAQDFHRMSRRSSSGGRQVAQP